MKDFRSRKKEKVSYMQHPLFSVVLFIVLLLVTSSVYKSYEKKKRADLGQNKFTEKYENLLNRKAELSRKIENLKTENGMKEEIKKTYNVGEEGETIIHITEKRD